MITKNNKLLKLKRNIIINNDKMPFGRSERPSYIEINGLIYIEKDLNDLMEGATLSHLYVENRNIEGLYTLKKEELLNIDIDGETALHYAVFNDDVEICKILINKNKDIVNIKDIDNKTAYDWAMSYNEEYNSHTSVCEFLKNYS